PPPAPPSRLPFPPAPSAAATATSTSPRTSARRRSSSWWNSRIARRSRNKSRRSSLQLELDEVDARLARILDRARRPGLLPEKIPRAQAHAAIGLPGHDFCQNAPVDNDPQPRRLLCDLSSGLLGLEHHAPPADARVVQNLGVALHPGARRRSKAVRPRILQDERDVVERRRPDVRRLVRARTLFDGVGEIRPPPFAPRRRRHVGRPEALVGHVGRLVF